MHKHILQNAINEFSISSNGVVTIFQVQRQSLFRSHSFFFYFRVVMSFSSINEKSKLVLSSFVLHLTVMHMSTTIAATVSLSISIKGYNSYGCIAMKLCFVKGSHND